MRADLNNLAGVFRSEDRERIIELLPGSVLLPVISAVYLGVACAHFSPRHSVALTLADSGLKAFAGGAFGCFASLHWKELGGHFKRAACAVRRDGSSHAAEIA